MIPAAALRSYEAICPRCKGKKWVFEYDSRSEDVQAEDCPKCDGKGVVEAEDRRDHSREAEGVAADFDRLRSALTLALVDREEAREAVTRLTDTEREYRARLLAYADVEADNERLRKIVRDQAALLEQAEPSECERIGKGGTAHADPFVGGPDRGGSPRRRGAVLTEGGRLSPPDSPWFDPIHKID